MRVLVCGGRKYNDQNNVWNTLDALCLNRGTPTVIIHGDQTGADKLADEWAFQMGVKADPYPADWGKYGNAAGPIRNRIMLDEGKPDLVLAFPGGKGTNGMTRLAEQAGIEVVRVPATS